MRGTVLGWTGRSGDTERGSRRLLDVDSGAARVQCVADAVTEDVEGQRGGQQGHRGEEQEPPIPVLEEPGRVADHRTPVGRGRRYAHAEERQRGLEYDR